MRLKKPFAAVTIVLMLLCLAMSPMFAFASVTLENGIPEVLPGNPRSSAPDYSMAWLDTVIVRDSTTSILTARLVPQADYPYSHTYSQFVQEVDRYAQLHDLNETTVGQAYNEVVQLFYYTATALGMTDDVPTMIAYLENYGIAMPQNPDAEDTATIAVVYAAIRYNAVYTLYGKEVTFPKGITLDAAEIIILSELTGVFLPSGVNSLTGFAVQAVKTHIQEFPELPISQNPSNAEVFHWSKVLTAAANQYQVPLTPYDEATKAQKDYVDYAYYASIFNTVYDVEISPARLAVADNSKTPNAIPIVILQAMLDGKNVPYSKTTSCEELFDMACLAGCFQLDEEFFSDIFNYDLYVGSNSTQVWFTPIALASQLGGNDDAVRIYLNGNEMQPSATAGVLLDPSKPQEQIEMTVVYNDGNPATADTATYLFNVIKTDETSVAATSNDLVLQMQSLLDSAVPAETQAQQQIVSSVISAVEAQGNNVIFDLNTLTTYDSALFDPMPVDGNAITNADGSVDFNYLGQLMQETYPDDETAPATDNLFSGTTSSGGDDSSLVTKTLTAIKENPQIAAAPTGIVALGGLVGYFWSKKRKDELQNTDDETDDNVTDELMH